MDSESWYAIAALILVMGVIRPLFWLIALTIPLWLCYRFNLPNKWGLLIFGHYWKKGQNTALTERRGNRRPP